MGRGVPNEGIAEEASMVRRVISTIVPLASAGLYTLTAAERATRVLTNGERRTVKWLVGFE
jgi:hypothetical protein